MRVQSRGGLAETLLRLRRTRDDDSVNDAMQRRLTVAATAAAVALALAGVAISLWANAADDKSMLGAGFDCAVALAFTLGGAVVVGARPTNAIGWLMLFGGVFWALGSAGNDLGFHGIVASPGSVPGASAWVLGGAAAQSTGWYLVTTAVPVVYPTGRVSGPRWHWLVTASIVIVIAAVIDPLTDPEGDRTGFGGWHNPIGLHGPWRAISSVAFLAHVPLSAVVTIAAIVQLVSRWRRGSAFERQQLNLFAAAVAVPIIAAPIALILGGGGWIFDATALPLPFTIGFAVLARGLFDLRTAANRTLVWVTLSATVAGLFALVIAGLAELLHVDRGSSRLLWISAAVVAVLFGPLRDSLQRTVNRLTFGRWDQPYDVLAALGQRVEAAGEVERLLADVASELEGLGLRHVTIADMTGTVLVGDVGSNGDAVDIPLSAYGEGIGTLSYLPPTTPLRARDRQLLDDLAGHLGGVLYAHRLTLDLQRAREQLVLAREEERRRLRRDLHDGLGPALAGHLLRLDVLAGRIKGDAAATADLNALRADLRETMTEVRRVVEGLRPPALDELGLIGSLHQVIDRLTSGTATRVVIAAEDLPPLPAAVEVAAFRIVTEAVTNVVKHAQATMCRVELSVRHGRMRLLVSDNGEQPLGARSSVAGHGLQTMKERADELRGRLTVGAGRDGAGTTVVAELPALPPPRARSEHTVMTASA
jgi:signal transduction histidine kinase